MKSKVYSPWMEVLKALGVLAGVLAALPIAILAASIVFMSIADSVAHAKIQRMERSIHAGEQRREIEAQFGEGLSSAYVGRNVVRYSFTYAAICVESERNLDISYDDRGRVQSWARHDEESGC